MKKISIKEIIITEGKYDKIKLSRIFDTAVFTTDGFDIYKNKLKLNMIKQAAEAKGAIILTDSDSAGNRIRNYIAQYITTAEVKNVYVPEIAGKEKRKDNPSKEGLLGVEGISDEVIINAVLSQTKETDKDAVKITKADFYRLGLTGKPDSSALRAKLSRKMHIPVKISANHLLEIVNVIYTKEQFENVINEIGKEA